jgi:hypothetical protein
MGIYVSTFGTTVRDDAHTVVTLTLDSYWKPECNFRTMTIESGPDYIVWVKAWIRSKSIDGNGAENQFKALFPENHPHEYMQFNDTISHMLGLYVSGWAYIEMFRSAIPGDEQTEKLSDEETSQRILKYMFDNNLGNNLPWGLIYNEDWLAAKAKQDGVRLNRALKNLTALCTLYSMTVHKSNPNDDVHTWSGIMKTPEKVVDFIFTERNGYTFL